MNKNIRNILALTGIRSEYDILSSVFEAISSHKNLNLQLVVSGAHLSETYGDTINEIKRDGFEIVDEIESLINGDRDSSRALGFAIQLQGLIRTVARIRPDMLLVLGDREESIAVALVGTYINIPVIHIGGGDRVIGNADDQIRHAVTKLAHLHLVTNNESKKRVLSLGEQAFRVFNVGNPGLDRFLSMPQLNHSELSKSINFNINENEPLLFLIQHPLSTEIEDAYKQMKISLQAIRDVGIKTIISYPNSDAGSQQMIRAIKEFESLPNLFVAKNIPRLEFINLLRKTSCLLGNSSAGILEAPLIKIPVINIGNRQKGRLHANNIQFVPHSKSQIIKAIKQAVFDKNYRDNVHNCHNPYGDGQSSKRIADIISKVKLDEKLLIKDITY